MNTTSEPVPVPTRRALWGCSPRDLPADTAWKRRVDRFVPRSGVGVALYFGAVFIALNLAPLAPRRGELTMVGLAALADFWRCRHAHCLVGGLAWPALAALSFVEAGLGRSLIAGDEQVIFAGILVASLLLEGMWCCTRGTNAITSRALVRDER